MVKVTDPDGTKRPGGRRVAVGGPPKRVLPVELCRGATRLLTR
jgi:hypothetical protein